MSSNIDFNDFLYGGSSKNDSGYSYSNNYSNKTRSIYGVNNKKKDVNKDDSLFKKEGGNDNSDLFDSFLNNSNKLNLKDYNNIIDIQPKTVVNRKTVEQKKYFNYEEISSNKLDILYKKVKELEFNKSNFKTIEEKLDNFDIENEFSIKGILKRLNFISYLENELELKFNYLSNIYKDCKIKDLNNHSDIILIKNSFLNLICKKIENFFCYYNLKNKINKYFVERESNFKKNNDYDQILSDDLSTQENLTNDILLNKENEDIIDNTENNDLEKEDINKDSSNVTEILDKNLDLNSDLEPEPSENSIDNNSIKNLEEVDEDTSDFVDLEHTDIDNKENNIEQSTINFYNDLELEHNKSEFLKKIDLINILENKIILKSNSINDLIYIKNSKSIMDSLKMNFSNVKLLNNIINRIYVFRQNLLNIVRNNELKNELFIEEVSSKKNKLSKDFFIIKIKKSINNVFNNLNLINLFKSRLDLKHNKLIKNIINRLKITLHKLFLLKNFENRIKAISFAKIEKKLLKDSFTVEESNFKKNNDYDQILSDDLSTQENLTNDILLNKENEDIIDNTENNDLEKEDINKDSSNVTEILDKNLDLNSDLEPEPSENSIDNNSIKNLEEVDEDTSDFVDDEQLIINKKRENILSKRIINDEILEKEENISGNIKSLSDIKFNEIDYSFFNDLNNEHIDLYYLLNDSIKNKEFLDEDLVKQAKKEEEIREAKKQEKQDMDFQLEELVDNDIVKVDLSGIIDNLGDV